MKQLTITGNDFNKICRLCLTCDVTMTGVFWFSSKLGKKIADIIMECTPIQITKRDEMPTCICQLCYNKLDEIHQFQMQAVQSEETLRRYIQQMHSSEKQIKPECSASSEHFENQIKDLGVNITVKYESLEMNDIFSTDVNRYPLSSDFSNTENQINEGTPSKSEEIIFANINMGSNTTKAVPEHYKYFSKIKSECCNQNSSQDLGNKTSHLNVDITVKCEPAETHDEDIDQWTPEIPENPNTLNFINDEFPNKSEEVFRVQIKEESSTQLNLTDINTNSECSDGRKISYEDTKIVSDDTKMALEYSPPNEYVNSNSCSSKLKNVKEKPSINKKSHQCDDCKQCLKKLDDLKEHTLIHTGEEPYQCDICKQCFRDLFNLKRHGLIHTGEKPYRCDVCKKCFKELSKLKRHILTHTGEKPYQCDICKMCFTQAGHLKNHKLKHTEEKPYQCDACEMYFKHFSILSKHKLTHTGEKPHQCDVCKRCFRELSKLKRHKLTHTGEKPYECDVCKQCFRELSKLKRHKLTHTGEKPYECDFCNVCFSQSGHLKYHKLIHTGEKPFQCDVCQRCFRELSRLRKHKLTHTREKKK